MSTGIVDRIKRADTVERVASLVQELQGYKFASPRTIRRAARWAAIRQAQLKPSRG